MRLSRDNQNWDSCKEIKKIFFFLFNFGSFKILSNFWDFQEISKWNKNFCFQFWHFLGNFHIFSIFLRKFKILGIRNFTTLAGITAPQLTRTISPGRIFIHWSRTRTPLRTIYTGFVFSCFLDWQKTNSLTKMTHKFGLKTNNLITAIVLFTERPYTPSPIIKRTVLNFKLS